MVAILVLLTIVCFLLVDWIVQLLAARRARALLAKLGDPYSEQRALNGTVSPFSPPQGLFFHRGHSWAQLQPAGTAKIGIDGLISLLIGRIDEIRLPTPGQTITEGQPLATVRQGPRTLNLLCPMAGEVVDVNPVLAQDASRIAEEPYGNGWICIIRPHSLVNFTKELAVGEAVSEWHNREMERLADFVSGIRVNSTYEEDPEERLLVGGLLESASDSDWRRFQQDFLGQIAQEEGRR